MGSDLYSEDDSDFDSEYCRYCGRWVETPCDQPPADVCPELEA